MKQWKMKINLKNNTGLKLLSLAIAIILWYVIGNINDPVKTVVFSGIPVKVINADVLESNNKAYEITEGDLVTISARGKSSIVNVLSAEDFTATADMGKLSIVNAVPIDVSVSKNANQLEISLGRVNTLKVNIEDRVEAMLPVVIETEGNVADGYAIGSKISSPNMIEISGAESTIKRLKEIRVTVNVEDKSEDVSSRQSIKFYDQNGDEVISPNIDCDIAAVDVTIPLWKTKEIPLTMKNTGTPAEGYGISNFDYEPKTLVIAASDEKLKEITSWELDPLDVSGLKESQEKTISVDSSYLPDGVIFKDGTVDIVAKAVIEKKVTAQVKLKNSDIEIKGLPEGKTVQFDKSTYQIDVESFESKIDNLEGSSFSPYIDVTELGEVTEGKVRIHLVNPQGVTVGNTVTAEIKIVDKK